MSDLKCSPGPWVLIETPKQGIMSVASARLLAEGKPCIVCRIQNKESRSPLTDQDVANGHMLKASRELYDALDGLLHDLQERAKAEVEIGNRKDVVLACGNSVLHKAEKALAKARGES